VKKLIEPGRIIFAAGIIAFGIFQLIIGHYIVGRPPEPVSSVHTTWAYVSGIVLIILALGVVFHKKAGNAALVIALIIFVYSFLTLHLPSMFESSGMEILWFHLNAYKTLALAGGCLIIAASFFKYEKRGFSKMISNNGLIMTGVIFLSLFLLICGVSHFKFNEFVQIYKPAYVPMHKFWSYFTGVALLAGGVGLLIPSARKWAALLSGIMILCWFFLLHIPHVVNTPKDNNEWCGVFESFTISGMLFVLAGLSDSSRNKAI
jgi:uncharacterized membrane protein